MTGGDGAGSVAAPRSLPTGVHAGVMGTGLPANYITHSQLTQRLASQSAQQQLLLQEQQQHMQQQQMQQQQMQMLMQQALPLSQRQPSQLNQLMNLNLHMNGLSSHQMPLNTMNLGLGLGAVNPMNAMMPVPDFTMGLSTFGLGNSLAADQRKSSSIPASQFAAFQTAMESAKYTPSASPATGQFGMPSMGPSPSLSMNTQGASSGSGYLPSAVSDSSMVASYLNPVAQQSPPTLDQQLASVFPLYSMPMMSSPAGVSQAAQFALAFNTPQAGFSNLGSNNSNNNGSGSANGMPSGGAAHSIMFPSGNATAPTAFLSSVPQYPYGAGKF